MKCLGQQYKKKVIFFLKELAGALPFIIGSSKSLYTSSPHKEKKNRLREAQIKGQQSSRLSLGPSFFDQCPPWSLSPPLLLIQTHCWRYVGFVLSTSSSRYRWQKKSYKSNKNGIGWTQPLFKIIWHATTMDRELQYLNDLSFVLHRHGYQIKLETLPGTCIPGVNTTLHWWSCSKWKQGYIWDASTTTENLWEDSDPRSASKSLSLR